MLQDKSRKPIKLTAIPGPVDDVCVIEEGIDTENPEKLEAGVGTMYVLGTHRYTKEGEEIVKIGISTGSVDARINQLYTIGVPFRFRVINLHRLLEPYRINRSREFFIDGCLP